SPDGTVAHVPGGAPAWVRAMPVADHRLEVTRWVGPSPADVAKEVWTFTGAPDENPGPSPPVRIKAAESAVSSPLAPDPDHPPLGEHRSVDQLPEATEKTQPVYPDEIRKQGIEGTVLVQALVGRDGLVKDVAVTKSIPQLDPYAIAAVKQ